MSSKMLITDYSSAACDFAYLEKPVIYANFDYDHIFDIHYYNKGYFDYDENGFGPNCKSYEQLVQTIIDMISNDVKLRKNIRNAVKRFFTIEIITMLSVSMKKY